MKKINIIYVIPALGLGGAERMLVDLVLGLDRQRFTPMVVCLIRGGVLTEQLMNAGIPVIVIGKKTKLGIGALFKLASFLDSQRPDIVHTHLFGGDFWGRVATLMIRRDGKPAIVTTEHNMNLGEGVVKRWIKRRLAPHTHVVIAVSQAVRDYALKVEKVMPQKMAVISNGVSLPAVSATTPTLSHRPGAVIFGTIARLEPQKGHDHVVKALRGLREENWEYWIVGDGSQRKKLERLVERYELEPHVKFLGWQVRATDYLRQMDIFVLASRWEGQGIALIEAGLAGLPVVATNVGGIPEVVTNEVTGVLVPPRSERRLAEALERLLKNGELRSRLGKQAKVEMKEKFNLTQMIDRYTAVYESLAG